MKTSMEVIPKSWLPIMRGIEFIGVLVAIGVVLFDFLVERPVDRAVRKATLFTQMAQTHALEDGAGLKALRPTILALLDEGIPVESQILKGVDLYHANLRKARFSRSDLTGANLGRANLTGADLLGADLSGAYLRGAEISGANFTDANLSAAYLMSANLMGAYLTGANLARANFTDATHLTQDQLDSACIIEGGEPPILPKGLKPPQKVCEPWIW